jgi:hypothetical protein
MVWNDSWNFHLYSDLCLDSGAKWANHKYPSLKLKSNKNVNNKVDISYNFLPGHVAQNWNTILPSLLAMNKKLIELADLYQWRMGGDYASQPNPAL